MDPVKYFISWFRFHQQDGYLLWIETLESERLWTDDEQRVVAFKSQNEIAALAQRLNIAVEASPPQLVDLDEIAAWLIKPENAPPLASLHAWNMFDDLSQSVAKPFSGNVKAPVRNRIFDLLYATAGPWRSASAVVWPRQERNVLRRILYQGFRLWNKHVYWSK